jgi:glycosyltransferase involved in cell wall biosynthesis
MKEKISIISTCFNEEGNILDCYQSIKNVLDNYNYEHIFVDNYSTDNSRSIIREICNKDKNIKAIFNSKNYGPFLSNYNALNFTSGEIIFVNFPTDMQDPPEKILEMITEIQKGFDIVYGVKIDTDENIFMKLSRNLFYFIINKFSNNYYPQNVNEFICVKKKIIDAVKGGNDYFPYVRGYFAKISDNYSKVYYSRNKRKKGISKNSLLSLYSQATNGLISTMDKFIQILTLSFLFISIISFFFTIFVVANKIMYPMSAPKGFAFLTSVSLFFFSFILFLLCLILEYLVAIHKQVRFNNKVLVEAKLNFD